MKKVLVVGGGGREHALLWKLSQSPDVEKLFVAPGNGGTAKLAENVSIAATDIENLVKFVQEKDIDFTIVGQDDPLALGLVDRLREVGKKVVGPVQAAAQIEASKAFAKELMTENNIPTAEFKVFKEFDAALGYVNEHPFPSVVKVSGLAAGKGVVIARTPDEARKFLEEIFLEKKYGASGEEVVIEEFLEGPEISIHAFCDGTTSVLFPAAQDHKTISEGGTGPNTGGMGTIAPLPWMTDEMLNEIREKVVEPALGGLASKGADFSGILFPGLKMTPKGPKVLEFNARFGDPETQSYMRLLKSDVLPILEACADNTLAQQKIEWNTGFVATVILASRGYPNEYKKGFEISGIEDAEKDERVVIFHAGTKITEEGKLVTNGGRVLGVSATGETLALALETAYSAVEKINFEGKYFRRDIGQETLKMGV